MAFSVSSVRVTEEDWLSETDLSGPHYFFWTFLLLLKELIIIFSLSKSTNTHITLKAVGILEIVHKMFTENKHTSISLKGWAKKRTSFFEMYLFMLLTDPRFRFSYIFYRKKRHDRDIQIVIKTSSRKWLYFGAEHIYSYNMLLLIHIAMHAYHPWFLTNITS